jgi:hypothetical protein
MKTTRVHHQLANNDAIDLEHEVWRLWLDKEPAPATDDGHDGDGGGGNADAASAKKHNRRTRDRETIHLGSMRFIIDTGCGSNLIALNYVQNAGAIDMMKELQVPITLNTAGGLSSALGTVKIACDWLLSGKFEAIVMPETPSVISVGELCIYHGYSFYWKSGTEPYLLLPNEMRVDLPVDDQNTVPQHWRR